MMHILKLSSNWYFEVCLLVDDIITLINLSSLDRDPLEWSTRVQIALDSARGLEYIHEHTVPVYIHRDIKSANILIDKKFHAKVAMETPGSAKFIYVGHIRCLFADFIW